MFFVVRRLCRRQMFAMRAVIKGDAPHVLLCCLTVMECSYCYCYYYYYYYYYSTTTSFFLVLPITKADQKCITISKCQIRNEKLSCHREVAQCFVSLNISLRHSRLLKVTENGTIRKLGYGFLFALHSNCCRIFSRFDTIHERDGQTDTARRHWRIGRAYA